MASGPMIAGLTGSVHFNYDIWGDTCMIAKELARNAPANSILVSEETRWFLSNKNFILEPHRDISIVELMSVKTFLFKGKRSDNNKTFLETQSHLSIPPSSDLLQQTQQKRREVKSTFHTILLQDTEQSF